MGFGLGILRLDPISFWAMTPRELNAAYRGLVGKAARMDMPRAALDELISAFPDQTGDEP